MKKSVIAYRPGIRQTIDMRYPMPYKSIREASKKTGIPSRIISLICNGEYKVEWVMTNDHILTFNWGK